MPLRRALHHDAAVCLRRGVLAARYSCQKKHSSRMAQKPWPICCRHGVARCACRKLSGAARRATAGSRRASANMMVRVSRQSSRTVRPSSSNQATTYTVGASPIFRAPISFPSGHTSLNFATFTALVAVLIKEKKNWAWVLLMFIPVIVGFTRIIRCVHYPSDVLAGMIIGIVAGLIGYLLVEKVLPKAFPKAFPTTSGNVPQHSS